MKIKDEDEKEDNINQEDYLNDIINDYYYYILILLVIIFFLLINNLLNYLLLKKTNFNNIQSGGYIPESVRKIYTSKTYRNAQRQTEGQISVQKKYDRKTRRSEGVKKRLLSSSSRFFNSASSVVNRGVYGIGYTVGSALYTLIITVMILIVFAPSIALVAVVFFSLKMIIPKILQLKEL